MYTLYESTNTEFIYHLISWHGYNSPTDTIITLSWRQNDVATSFWRQNNVISASCVRWERLQYADPEEDKTLPTVQSISWMMMADRIWPSNLLYRTKKNISWHETLFHYWSFVRGIYWWPVPHKRGSNVELWYFLCFRYAIEQTVEFMWF